MPVVVIAGLPHTEKDSIVSLVLSRYSQGLPPISFLHRPEKKQDMKKNLIVSSDIFVQYDNSYELLIPLAVKEMKKDLAVLFELETDRPDIREWQEMNRAYAAAHFSCRLKFIKVKKGHLNRAMQEFLEAMKEVFV